MNTEERCEDRHAAACAVCSDGGDLLCCDACPTAVHHNCVGLETIPEVCASSIQPCTRQAAVRSCSQVSASIDTCHKNERQAEHSQEGREAEEIQEIQIQPGGRAVMNRSIAVVGHCTVVASMPTFA